MKGIRQFHALLLLILCSFAATAQTVNSVTIGPNQYNCNTLLTATVQGVLPNMCTSVDASANVQGNYINLYLTFTTQPGVCTQVVTPFTQNIIVGTLPVGTYTIRTYSTNTGLQIFGDQQFTVSCSGCAPPTLGHLYATNITYNSIKINCTLIPGVVYYQFLYRRVGSSYWYSTPSSSNNYWNMTGLVSNANYEYRCRVYCNGAWTNYSPSQYCSTQGAQPSGNSCNNAIVLNCGVTYSGSNNTGSYSYSNYVFPNGAQFTNMTGPEAFHKFTVTNTSNVTITLNGLSQNLHLFLLSNCNTNCNLTGGMGYSCNVGNNNEQLTMNNLAPGTYIVVVDGWQGAYCHYNLTIQCTAVVVCPAPNLNQVYLTNLTSTSVRLNTSASGAYYDWSYRPAGGAWVPLPSGPQNYYDLTGLQPGVSYQFTAAIKCSNNIWSVWSPIFYCTTPSYNPGANCSNAIPVTCGNSYGGNNGTGGYNYPHYTYNGQTTAESGPEVVYKITIAANTSLTLKLTNLYGDLDLFLLGSCNGNNAVIALSGNNGANNESLTVNNLPAGTYYIVVDGWNGCISNYLLTVLCNNNGGNNVCSNDDPCGAQILSSNAYCTPTTGTNTGATMTTNPVAAGGCNSYGMQDVWYAVQMPATGKMKVTTGAGTLTNALLGIYSGSNCSYLNCYGCIDNTNGNYMPEVTITGSPGIWIFLRVWGYAGSHGTFTICVTTVSSGGNSLQGADEEPAFASDDQVVSDRNSGQEENVALPPEAGTYSLQLFPVPAQDELNLRAQLPAEQPADIRVFDLNGRLVQELLGRTSIAGHLTEQMAVAALPTGLYIVKVRAGDTELTSKFTKIQ